MWDIKDQTFELISIQAKEKQYHEIYEQKH